MLIRSPLALGRVGSALRFRPRSRDIISYLIPSARQKEASDAESSTSDAARPIHPTLRLIQQRYAEGSLPGQRTDPWKLGLVVEVRAAVAKTLNFDTGTRI